jgi:hypothetical protein
MVGEDLGDGRRDLRTAVHLVAVDANQATAHGLLDPRAFRSFQRSSSER